MLCISHLKEISVSVKHWSGKLSLQYLCSDYGWACFQLLPLCIFYDHNTVSLFTGGLFGNFDGKLNETLLSTKETNRVQKLNDFVDL